MNDRQKAFADYYIECGNGAEAARRAGYSEKTADRIANENLRKPEIAAYIAERVRPTEEKRIATGDEVMMFFTKVMNGEIKDAFGLEASLQDRLNAARELAKRTVDVSNRNNSGAEVVEGMKSLAEIVLQSRPNRNLADYE